MFSIPCFLVDIVLMRLFYDAKVHYLDRLAPLVGLQKKVYMSILRKELPKLLAVSSGGPNHQSLQNIVC